MPSAFWQWPDAPEPAVLVSRGAAVLIAIAAALGIGRLVAAIRHGERPAIVVSTILVCQLAMVALLPGEAWYYYLDPMLPLVALAAGALVGETAAARPRPVRHGARGERDRRRALARRAERAVARRERTPRLPGARSERAHARRPRRSRRRRAGPPAVARYQARGRDGARGRARRLRDALARHAWSGLRRRDRRQRILARPRRRPRAPTPSAPSRHAALWYRDDPTAPTVATPGFELVDLGPLRLVRYAPAIAYDRCRDGEWSRRRPGTRRACAAALRRRHHRAFAGPSRADRVRAPPGKRCDARRRGGHDRDGRVAGRRGNAQSRGSDEHALHRRGDSPAPFIVEIERPSGTAGDLDLYERPDPACRRKIAP